MNIAGRATSGVATRAEGSLAHCGSSSGDFELWYSCQGPSCSSLDGSLQNVVCHKDGSSTLICSSDTKCQPGTFSYQSNFTFSQNEPDPWSPTMENEPDVWVPQDQHVMVGGCAKFSLTSDGTKEGTHINDVESTCPNVQRPSTPAAMVGNMPASTDRPHVGATQRPNIIAGTSTSRSISKVSFLLLALAFAAAVFFPCAEASSSHHRPNKFRQSSRARIRATSEEPRDFAEGLINNLANRASAQGYNGHAFANDLVAGVVSSVCRESLEGSNFRPFDPEVLNSCVASAYGGEQVPQPALRFLAVFGGSILCNFIVSGTWQDGQDFSHDVCVGLQYLMTDLRKHASILDDMASIAAGTSGMNSGLPGSSLLAASTFSAQALGQSISISLVPESTASWAAYADGSTLGTAAAHASPSGAFLPSLLSAFSAPTDDLPSSALSSDTSGSASLPELAPSGLLTAAASLAQVPELLKPSIFDGESTDKAFSLLPSKSSLGGGDDYATFHGSVERPGPTIPVRTTATALASHVARPPNTGFGAASRFSNDFVDASSITSSPASVAMLTGLKLSSKSGQITSAQHMNPSKSSPPVQVQTSSIMPSIHEQEDKVVFPTPTQSPSLQVVQDKSFKSDTTNTPSQSDPSRQSYLPLKQPPSGGSSVKASRPTAVDSPTAPKLSHDGSAQGLSPQAQVPDAQTGSNIPGFTQNAGTKLSGSGQVGIASPSKTTASGMHLNIVDEGGSLLGSKQSGSPSTSMLAEPAKIVIWASTQGQQSASIEAASIATNILPVVRPSSIGPETNVLTSEFGDVTPLSPHKATQTTMTSAKIPVLDDLSAHHLLSGESFSLTAAGRATDTNAVDEPSLTLKSLEVLETTNVDKAASAVAASVVTSSIDSTAAASLPSIAGSLSKSASVLLSSHAKSTAAARFTGSFMETVNIESLLWSGSLSLAESSATALPVGDPNRTAILPLVFTSSSSDAYSQSLIPSAEIPSDAFASPISASALLPSSAVVSLITSISSQTLVPEPSPIDMSIPFGNSGYENSVYSSSESLLSATVPPISLSQANAVVASLNGNFSPKTSGFASNEGTLPTTLPGVVVYLTSNSSHTTLNTTTHFKLATWCARNSSAPSFCPGVGCVSFVTNQAHCGACRQICAHLCYRGACVCPDFTSPDEKHGCESSSIHVDCGTNYFTRNANSLKVCASTVWSTISSTPTPTSNRSSIIRSAAPSIGSSLRSGSSLFLTTIISVGTLDTEPTGCLPNLPDVCDGSCFNTMSEHNHCGGCGNFCSGTCVAGSCLVISTRASPQLASTGRMVTKNDLQTTAVRQTSTATVQSVAAYIWRGLGGPR